MNTEIIFIVEESPEEGFEARSLEHSIYCEADSLDELRAALKDAVLCHFEDADRPKFIRMHLTRDELISV